MTTNRTDFTKKQRLSAFYHNAMWLKEHDVEGERHSGMNGIWCQFVFPGKNELTPGFHDTGFPDTGFPTIEERPPC